MVRTMLNQLKPLQDVFQRRAFRIPEYQRGYAWDAQQREDLLSDLEDLDTSPGDKMHYTGTLVLHRGRHASKHLLGKSIDVVDIVDGQQRLTTIVVLLSVIARRFKEVGTPDALEQARNIEETYIAYRDLQKLVPSGDSGGFFRDHVIGSAPNPAPASAPERSLLAARTQFEQFFDRQLSDVPLADVLASLDRWLALITARLGFVEFEVRDEADVGVMFESMNARGKKLTQFELVKNYLLYAASKATSGEELHAITEDVNHTWAKVVRILDAAELSTEDDTLLRYHWRIWPHAVALDGDSLSKTHDIHRALKSVLRAPEHDLVLERIRDYLADLRLATHAFADIQAPRRDKAFASMGENVGPLVDRASAISRIGRSATVVPLLMAAVIRLGHDQPGMIETMRLAEAFAFRLSIVGSRANAGESKLALLARKLRDPVSSVAKTQDEFRDIIRFYAPDKTVQHYLLHPDGDSDDGNFYTWPTLRFFLFEYERHLLTCANKKVVLDWDEFYGRRTESIEHILPQGENTLKEPYWAQRFTAESWKRNKHRLGNLVATEWNSHYGNKGFDIKLGRPETDPSVKAYRNSRFQSERELARVAEWNEAAIQDRQETLAKFALERWRV
ncbi:MAG: hypothetical protein JWN04_6680 [Myxococcaceae bacterium]|nr:hypothetical protein [Myxococcaceae bacterium]